MFIEPSIIKENGALLVLLLYLIHLRTRRLEWVFHIGILSLYSFAILYTLLHIRGYDLIGFLRHPQYQELGYLQHWQTWTTPAMYLVFTLLTYGLAYHRTLDHPYSITLACHMTLATGYLYEAPRFLYLVGLRGMIRVSKYSIFYVDYAIIAIPVIMWLLYRKKINLNPIVLIGLQNYEVYFLVFWIKYEWLQEIRWAPLYGYRLPWINLYRVPTMIMMLLAVSQLKALNYGIE